MKKVNGCADGGYAKMQLKLLAGADIACASCKQLLEERGFKKTDFDNKIAAILAGEDNSVSQIPETAAQDPAAQGPQMQADAGHPGEPQVQADAGRPGEDNEDGVGDQRARALAFLKTVEPTMTLLASGSFGKKTPVRCNVCRSRTWPHGKVLEAGRLKEYMVRHFVTQHLQSPTHLRNLAKAQASSDIQVDQVPCEGLHLSDDQNAGKLLIYKQEFEVWASLTNFEGFAKHTYSRHCNDNEWVIRAQSCEQTCAKREGVSKQVCKECMALGRGHSVPWHDFSFCFFVWVGWDD